MESTAVGWVPRGTWLAPGYAEWPAPVPLRSAVACLWARTVPDVLVTQDMSTPMSAGIDLAYSCSPTGPFVDETTAYTTPETGADGTYRDADVYAYNPHEHPEVDRGNRLVISYNVNSLKNADLYRKASIYRPRFMAVSLARSEPETGQAARLRRQGHDR